MIEGGSPLDGLNFKCSSNIIDNYFTRDKYGSFIPDKGLLSMDIVSSRLSKQLSTDTGLYQRLASIYERTDVQFSDNPLGNTVALGVGVKMLGKRPLNIKKGAKLSRLKYGDHKITHALDKRQSKIVSIHNELYKVYQDLAPTLKTGKDQLLYAVEGDQVMTGGGFDNNHLGEVHKSGLHFISDSSAEIDYRDTDLSRIVVDCCLWTRDHLVECGLTPGSIQPMGASVVRAAQDNDGMFGYPVYAAGYDEWTVDLAKRMVIESGVDTSKFVGTEVFDKALQTRRKFSVIDAAGYILENKVFSANDMVSLVSLLARIQKHGWKMDNGKLIAKPGKTRSVYPNAFLPAVIESMIIAPFNNRLKELKVDIMPSLQDKPTRVVMITKMIKDALSNGYDYLAADWSKYDASVKGCILATIMQLVVKPFINKAYYYWIDAATYILCYKYILFDRNLCEVWPEEHLEAQKMAPHVFVRNYEIFGLVDGLISGAKFTHVGGSIYGIVVVHGAVPTLMGLKPIFGAQAGDDTLVGVPKEIIDVTSVNNTYDPYIAAAEKFGLHANSSKQIFHQHGGEIVKVFLQDSYHAETDTWGVGSIFRPADAVWYSEHDKGLSIAEQLMAEIARMNQGADSPFVRPVVQWWLSKERYLGWLFKDQGVRGFQSLVDVIGVPVDEIKTRIGVGSFSFGVDENDLQHGTLPILPIMAEVAHEMDFTRGDAADFLQATKPGDDKSGSSAEVEIIDEDDSGIA